MGRIWPQLRKLGRRAPLSTIRRYLFTVALDLSYRFSRLQSPDAAMEALCGCTPETLTRHQTSYFINILKNGKRPQRQLAAATAISGYLLDKGLAEMLAFYSNLSPSNRDLLVRNLIMPGEIQQVDAKLRGHGIEGVLAKTLLAVGAKIIPQDKAENPMGEHDPNIDPTTMLIAGRNPATTFSTDLVVLDESGSPKIFVVGLIHTSDPGQFGVDKSNTVVSIRHSIEQHNRTNDRKVHLFGLVDGVGYSENKAGIIEKMIPEFHCTLQNHSIYKAGLYLHKIGMARIASIAFDPDFYTEQAKQYMLKEHVSADISEVNWGTEIPHTKAIIAGKAVLYVPVP